MGTEVQLIKWDYDLEKPARLVQKHHTLCTSSDGKCLPLYICVGREVFKRLFASKLYVRL